MGDNNEQEDADLAAMNDDDDDDDNLFEVRYLGGRLDNFYNAENPRPHDVPDYIIPDDVHMRLVIGASITKIDMFACYNCHMLREVIFHNNVTEIGRYAFTGCSNLERIELPAGLLRLEDYAFHSCKSLREIMIPASVQYMGDAVFRGCTSLESVVFVPTPNMVELGSQMFFHCTNLRFVTLPQNLHYIPAYFFEDCISLTHFQLPVSVTEIGGGAFASSGIRAMNVSVGDDFMPETLILPPNLHSIPRSCFKDCKSLTHIRIPHSVEEIEAYAFDGSGLWSLEVSENVRQIGWQACGNCSSLKKVIIHSTNLNLATDIFVNCPSLSVIMIAPWLWAKLFASMNGQPDFIIKFFRQYHTQIFDFETPVVLQR